MIKGTTPKGHLVLLEENWDNGTDEPYYSVYIPGQEVEEINYEYVGDTEYDDDLSVVLANVDEDFF